MSRVWSRLLPSSLILAAILILVLVQTQPHSPSIVHAQTTAHPSYAGDQSCLPCHKAEASTYLHTAHHLSAQLPTHASILGSFTPPKNTLRIANQNPSELDPIPTLLFRMDATANHFTETAILSTPITSTKRTESIDLVIGSGTRGQTYLYWATDKSGEPNQPARLFELPISYWTDGHQWINSPGYQDGTADFSRPVNARCLECHTAAIRSLSANPMDFLDNSFDRASLTLGISCENCHGPAAAHVAFEKNNAKLPQGSHQKDSTILNPAHFSRDLKVDQCALCHDGTQSQQLQPAFTYLPNQPLDHYLATDPTTVSDTPDVHGNQVALLKKSRCYLNSPTMSCDTCHNPHSPERPAAAYSDRCLTCHQWQACGASKTLGQSITHDCISCHMPLQRTAAIVSTTSGRVTHTSIRTHWIKIYPPVALNQPH